MTYHVDIPESVGKSIRLPLGEIEPRLRTELALALYAQGILSFGKACELADTSRFAFEEIPGQREIPRHHGDDDLAQDLGYARGQQHIPYILNVFTGEGNMRRRLMTEKMECKKAIE